MIIDKNSSFRLAGFLILFLGKNKDYCMKLGLMLDYSGSKASVPTELVIAAESLGFLLFGQPKLGVLMRLQQLDQKNDHKSGNGDHANERSYSCNDSSDGYDS